MKAKEVDKLLKSIYYDLKSPQAYTSREKVYQAAKIQAPEIQRKEVNFGLDVNLLLPYISQSDIVFLEIRL